MQLLCLGAGLVLGALSLWSSSGTPEDGYLLERRGPGQGQQEYSLSVAGLDQGEAELKVVLEERIYTKEEAEAVYDQLQRELPQMILGGNPSLDAVSSDLELLTSADDLGIRLKWQSEDPELVDSFGRVYNRELGQQGEETLLHVRMTDGRYLREMDLKVRILPPKLTPEEREMRQLQEEIQVLEEASRQESWVQLPASLGERSLRYGLKEDTGFWALPTLGLAGAVLLEGREKEEQRRRERKRQEQLLADYSEVLSRLIIFLGAGMSVRSAWNRMAGDYRRGLEQGRWKERYAYEAMYTASCQLASGMPESRVFEEFGRQCGLQPYMKLGGILEQNRKNGSRNLKDTLKLEMADAFEQRKQQARRMGEEAGTKLLLPLFMLLSVVMVMIAVPALMGFV